MEANKSVFQYSPMTRRFALLFGILFFAFAGSAQVTPDVHSEDLNLIHLFKQEGPVSIQCIWAADSMPYTWFQAALHSGTKSHPGEEFLHICEDYRIEFELREFNGGYALGVTFALSKLELVLTLLEDLLNQTNWSQKEIKEWKRKELYHYQYYKNDPDSIIKWWMSGREAHYSKLGSLNFDKSSPVLSLLMGSPQLISVVGRINRSQIEERLSKFIKTAPSSFTPRRSFEAAPYEFREGMKNFYGVQVVKIHTNPLLSHLLYTYSFHQLGGASFASVVSDKGFESPRVSMVTAPIENLENSLAFEVEESVRLSLVADVLSTQLFNQLYEQASVHFYQWLEYNRNEALYRGLVQAGVWDVVDSLKRDSVYEILRHTVRKEMFIKFYAPKEH